jgi:hypothetical protein
METIIVAILGSGALSALISGIFNLINNSKARRREVSDQLAIMNNRLDKIEKNQAVSEKDELRTQLLMMLADYPDEIAEIMKLAEHYFADLEGNWYLSSLFERWLEQKNVVTPKWFRKDK